MKRRREDLSILPVPSTFPAHLSFAAGNQSVSIRVIRGLYSVFFVHFSAIRGPTHLPQANSVFLSTFAATKTHLTNLLQTCGYQRIPCIIPSEKGQRICQ